MEKKHFDEIDIVKGIAILFVLWHHSFILYPINLLKMSWCQYAVSIHGTFFLNVFFLASGYLYACGPQVSFVDNLRKKTNRLLVPYLWYAIINLVVKLTFPALVNRQVVDVFSYVYKFLFAGGELWFCYVLFFIFLIWQPILKHLNKGFSIIVIILLLVGNIFIPGPILKGLFLYPAFLYYSIFFVMGYYVKDVNRDFVANKYNFWTISFLFVLLDVFLIQSINIPYVWRFITTSIGCYFIYSLSFQLLKVEPIKRALTFCGKYSLSYYWLNGFALVPARTLIINILHIEYTPMIAISIFLLCVISETMAILFLRKIRYIRTIVGVS